MIDHAANDATTPAALREALRPLLALRAAPFGGFSLEALDGFLTALAVGPDLVAPSEWLPAVWGKAEPRWESQEEAVRVYGMLLSLWNDVLRRVALDPGEQVDADDRPILDDGDAPRGQAWAEGFLDGVDFVPEVWAEWEETHEWIEHALLDIEALTYAVVPDGFVTDDDTPSIEHSDRESLLADLPNLIHALHRHRLVQETMRTPIRRETPKVGRNDPCPCGSGKKFKKCCG
ncbi:MAG: UPF0149 family protein [Proteobacteria bacterium]|nr:UPF0149 family protein [Pseudomonadota bacterium]